MGFGGLDRGVVTAYLGVVVAIALAFKQRAGGGLVEYFVSGRALPWWVAGTSMVATGFAADTPLAVTGLVAANGIAGNWFWWCFALGGMITVFVFAPLWRRSRVLTDVELIELRYTGRPAAALRGLRALYVALIVNSIIIGWVTGAMLKILRLTVVPAGGGTGDTALVIALLGVVGIYSVVSGLWGVAVADVLQFVLAMAGCILLAVVAVDHVGGTDALKARLDATFEGGSAQALAFLPDFSGADPWMLPSAFLVLLFVQWWSTWYPGAEPGGGGYVVQRMAACKNERHALGATLWYQIAYYCVRPWPWLLVALVALVLHPELRDWALDADSATDAGEGFPMVMRDLAPPGVAGLLLVTFFAAYMSTISTQMNWGASYLVNDVWKRFFAPEADDRSLVRASRLASAFVLVLGGCASFLMKDVSVDEAWKLLAALGAGSGAVYMLRWFWWRVNAWSEITAMFASLFWFLVLEEHVVVAEHRVAFVSLATIATWLLVTFLTRPEPDGVLEAFYRRVRPAGPGWRPVARRAPDVKSEDRLGRALCAALFGAGVVYLTLPAVGWLIFGRTLHALLAFAGAGVCAYMTLRLGLGNQRASIDGSSRDAAA